MTPRRRQLVVILISLCLPAFARAQAIDAEDREAVESPAAGARQEGPDLEAVARQVIERTNAFRREQGLDPVRSQPALTEAARYFAGYMARTDSYSHTADGARPADRAKKHGYDYCIVSENIAYFYSSAPQTADKLARQFFEGWKESPGHRKNMVEPYVTDTGVAVAQSEKSGYYYAVQMFGRPASARLEFQIANNSDDTVNYEVGGRTFSLPPRYTRTHQRCRPGDVTFHWPEGRKDAKEVVTPAGGDRYTVARGPGGGLQVKKQ
jgi:uncharacterized protein YkwD